MKTIHPIFAFAGVAAVVYGAMCAYLYVDQRSYLYAPQAASEAPAFMMSVPGAELKILHRPVAGKKALIYFGGNADNVVWAIPVLGKAFPDRSLYLMNYRSYSGSSGKPSEAALSADALALFDRVKALHGDVAVMGLSLGTGVAVRLASERPVSRLVLAMPYDSLQEVAVKQMPMFPVRWLLIDKFESWRYAPKVTAPTTIIIAEQDTVIPPASSELLASRFKSGLAKVVRIEGVGHQNLVESPAFVTTLLGDVVPAPVPAFVVPVVTSTPVP